MLRLDAALLARGLTRDTPLHKLASMAYVETKRPWRHRPAHVFLPRTTYMVTAGTLHKEHFFNDTSRLRMLHDLLLEPGQKYGWQMEAWAVFSNHYHWIGVAPTAATTLKKFTSHLHTATAKAINTMDRVMGRKIWFQYWDTCLTMERSYLARLNYVHNNAVHHKLVGTAEQYEFCSARWFAANSDAAFRHKVASFQCERLHVPDDF